MGKIVIKNVRTIENESLTNILIEDDRIIQIGNSISLDGVEEVFDFDGAIALPAIVNIHTHLDKANLSKEVVNESGSIWEARTKLLEYKKKITVESIKKRATEIIMESINDGVLFLRTHVDVDPIIGLKGIQALIELKEEVKDQIYLQIVAFPQEGITEAPGTYDLLSKAMEMGADVLGGHLSVAKDFREHSKRMFEIANLYDCDVDVHVDYDINRDYEIYRKEVDGKLYPTELGIVDLCFEKREINFTNRVVASHLCGLSSALPKDASNIIELMKEENIGVIALAPNNLYCNGRTDEFNIRRGVTLAKKLLENGINVSFGPDNIRDPFNPLGTPDMILNALITAYACHFSNSEEYKELFNMCTYRAAEIMGLENYGLKENCFADIVIFKNNNPEDILAEVEKPVALFRKGKLVF